MTSITTILAALGLACVAYSVTVIERRRRAYRFYLSMILGFGLIQIAMAWAVLV